jgi:nitrate reductase beta subunit
MFTESGGFVAFGKDVFGANAIVCRTCLTDGKIKKGSEFKFEKSYAKYKIFYSGKWEEQNVIKGTWAHESDGSPNGTF